MTITKAKKDQLLAKYKNDLVGSANAVIVKQSGIAVTVANKIRMELRTADGEMNIIKKRIFLRALKDAGLEEVNVDALEWSVFALYSHENEFGPLKVINKYLKEFKRENKWSEFSFIGGWFEKKWQGSEYVNELANVPTKEELLSKFSDLSLSHILLTDMMARYYNAKVGDIMRITRSSITSGKNIFYRKVINGTIDILF